MPDFFCPYPNHFVTCSNYIMVNSFSKYLAVERSYSPRTIRSYTDDVTQFFDYFGQPPTAEIVGTVNHRQIRAWISSLISQSVSTRSVNRKLSSLRAFYRYLLKQGVVKANPLARVSAPKNTKRLPEFVSEPDMDKMYQQALFDGTYEGQRNLLIISFLYMSGIRRSELVGLTVSAINLNVGTIKVLGKGNKERIIPMLPELSSLAKQYLKLRDKINISSQNALFLTPKGKPIYPEIVYRVVKHYLSMVTTLDKKSPHVLRHTFATHLLNHGADINAIKELLGHASLASTQVYTHNTFEKLRRNYNQAHPRA